MTGATLRIALIGAVALAAVAWAARGGETAPAAAAGEPPSPGIVSLARTDRWLDPLLEGRSVRFVAEPPRTSGGETVRAPRTVDEIRPLGRLAGDERERVRAILDGYLDGRREKLRRHRAAMDQRDTWAQVTEARLMREEARAEAARLAFEQHSYFVERGSGRQRRIPGASTLALTCRKDGEPAILTLVLRHEQHPALPSLDAYLEGTREFHAGTAAERFNRLALDRRRELLAAFDELRAGGDADAWRAFRSRNFPRGTQVDRARLAMIHSMR